MLQGEGQADVEEQKDHAQIREQPRRIAFRDEVEAVGADCHAREDVADDRARPERPRQQDCHDPDEQKQNRRCERRHGIHRLTD